MKRTLAQDFIKDHPPGYRSVEGGERSFHRNGKEPITLFLHQGSDPFPFGTDDDGQIRVEIELVDQIFRFP